MEMIESFGKLSWSRTRRKSIPNFCFYSHNFLWSELLSTGNTQVCSSITKNNCTIVLLPNNANYWEKANKNSILNEKETNLGTVTQWQATGDRQLKCTSGISDHLKSDNHIVTSLSLNNVAQIHQLRAICLKKYIYTFKCTLRLTELELLHRINKWGVTTKKSPYLQKQVVFTTCRSWNPWNLSLHYIISWKNWFSNTSS